MISIAAAVAAKLLQSCLTLCDPIDSCPPGCPVPGILQARTLEGVAISFSNACKWKVKSLSRVLLLVTPWTAAYQAPPSMGFSRQEYWSGLGCHCLLWVINTLVANVKILMWLGTLQLSLVAQLVMNLPAMWETWVQSLDWEDPLEKGKVTHSSILAWRMLWTV